MGLLVLFVTAVVMLFKITSPSFVNATSVCGGTPRGCSSWVSYSYCSAGGSCGSVGCNKTCYYKYYDYVLKKWVTDKGTCQCDTTCAGTSPKQCYNSGGSCIADGCGSGTCGVPTPPNCYWSCVPDCAGKQCGDDTCGGSCGTCGGGKVCSGNKCVNPCGATAPSNLSVARVTPTSSTLSWTPGSGGAEQRVYVGANKSEVEVNCNGTYSPACVVSATGLPTSQSSYSTGNVLTAGTVYYYRVVNWLNGSCAGTSATNTTISSCSITTNPLSVQSGFSATMATDVLSSTSISSVNFSSSNTSVATVNPASDTTYPYQTTVTGGNTGTSTGTADVIIGSSANCTATATINVRPPLPWWQVKDADVTANGNLSSAIPSTCSLPGCNPLFDLIGPGGYPGIPAYGSTVDFAAGSVSTPGWLANTTLLTSNNRQYTYAWFKRLIPADVTMNEIASSTIDGTALSSGGTVSGGYYYYHYNGSSGIDLTLNSAVSLGTRRVILLVDGADFNINGRINFTKGQGFFMAVVGKTLLGAKGNINVSSALGGGATPQLEGLYEADNAFHSGAGTSQLYIRGSVAAYGGMNLERNLTNNSATPAEVFEYAPDLVFTYPYKLRERRIYWQEVAP